MKINYYLIVSYGEVKKLSDGVSKVTNSWHHILQNHVKKHFDELLRKKEKQIIDSLVQINKITHNIPTTLEQLYYRLIFEKHYQNPIALFLILDAKYNDATDASAEN